MPATLRHACMDAESDVYLCGSEIFVEYVRNIILQYPHDSRRSHPHPGVRAHPLI